MDKINISVVIPVYGCKACLDRLHMRLSNVLRGMDIRYQIIFVSDGCPQGSWEVIRDIALKDENVKAIDLSRNFGQIRAITAGLTYSEGEWVVVMDCDLQDSPEEIPRLYAKALEGYDVVMSRRQKRKDGLVKKIISGLFYKVYGYFVNTKIDGAVSNFSICNKIVIKNYLKIKDQNRAYILFLRWMGFKSVTLDVIHSERLEGKSSYNLKRQLRLAAEVITTQSNKPLVISIKGGFFVSFVSLIYGVFLLARYFLFGVSVQGWTSTIVSIYFVGGLIFAQIGILGLYIGYVFDQTKDRPIFIVREIVESCKSGRPSS